MMNREKAIYIFEMYLTIQELIMNAGFPAYCYFSTEFNYIFRFTQLITLKFLKQLQLSILTILIV